MNDLAGVIVLVVLVGVLVLGAVGLGVFLAHWYMTKDAVPSQPAGPYDDFEAHEPEPEPPALKVDPSNPPTWKVYRGEKGPHCNCHDRRIVFGENILMWPDPEEPGAYRLFHEDFAKGLVP